MNDTMKMLIKRAYYIVFAAIFLISFFSPRIIASLFLPMYLIMGALMSIGLKMPLFGTRNIRGTQISPYTPADNSNNKTAITIGMILIALNYFM